MLPISQGPSASGQPMYQAQAVWQESVTSVVIGEAHLSSLMNDEAKSTLNELVTGHVREGRWKDLNAVEVNNVCDGGNVLNEALVGHNDLHEMAKR